MASTRRRRRATKKRKYLSLRRQLSVHAAPQPFETPIDVNQVDLFPDHRDDPDFASLLSDDSIGDGGSLFFSSLLGSTSDSTTTAADDLTPSPTPSEVSNGLARRALRGRERMELCSALTTTATSKHDGSNAGGVVGLDLWWCGASRCLLLKLDYEEILSAWSDRGSLYIDGEESQVVPDIHCTTPVFVDVGCTVSSSSWRVPDLAGEAKDSDDQNMISREARVRRYKEKRRNRLFSKQIRYQVRKLNAEKRPRIKGRFVKRNEDA